MKKNRHLSIIAKTNWWHPQQTHFYLKVAQKHSVVWNPGRGGEVNRKTWLSRVWLGYQGVRERTSLLVYIKMCQKNISSGLLGTLTPLWPCPLLLLGARRGVQKVCIVLTNEKKAAYKESKALKKAAEPLHQAGVRVIAIGVTSSADGNKLRALTEGPKDVIKSHSCDSLQAKFSYLFKRICYGVGKRVCLIIYVMNEGNIRLSWCMKNYYRFVSSDRLIWTRNKLQLHTSCIHL